MNENKLKTIKDYLENASTSCEPDNDDFILKPIMSLIRKLDEGINNRYKPRTLKQIKYQKILEKMTNTQFEDLIQLTLSWELVKRIINFKIDNEFETNSQFLKSFFYTTIFDDWIGPVYQILIKTQRAYNVVPSQRWAYVSEYNMELYLKYVKVIKSNCYDQKSEFFKKYFYTDFVEEEFKE